MDKPELPQNRREYEKFLRGHGFSKRRAVRLASAWPNSDEETEQEAEEEAAARIRSVLNLDREV